MDQLVKVTPNAHIGNCWPGHRERRWTATAFRPSVTPLFAFPLAALAAAPDPSALLARGDLVHLAAQKGDLVVAALLVLNGDSGELLNATDAEGRSSTATLRQGAVRAPSSP